MSQVNHRLVSGLSIWQAFHGGKALNRSKLTPYSPSAAIGLSRAAARVDGGPFPSSYSRPSGFRHLAVLLTRAHLFDGSFVVWPGEAFTPPFCAWVTFSGFFAKSLQKLKKTLLFRVDFQPRIRILRLL
ncbi:hypothetical protein PUV47_07880 [Pseudovibrio exalbescens]|uniref:hypothetical protein n=1 Tax=Pseudovibrio exalbescens TaxID=197461 RepID=UPI00236509B2|nr:hypothetical protein [Pseudovibrio exalbescens]MDD7909833.1 hypothetical protein [Pseudovibrio exalbescens]